jgi:hypothetical protein
MFVSVLFQVTRNITLARVVKSSMQYSSLSHLYDANFLATPDVSPDVLPEVTRAIKKDTNRILF